MEKSDVIIIGAGASGLMCAIEAGKRGRRVTLLDHGTEAGKKILISGGGRSNFSNYNVDASHFISGNPHFCKSALSRFSQWDYIAMMERHGIPFHEREEGQLFCDKSAREILNMLVSECEEASVSIRLSSKVEKIEHPGDCHFRIYTSRGDFHCQSLVVATGGLSLPITGATPFGYKVAEQFGIKIRPTAPGLVPLTLQPGDKARFSTLSGIAVEAIVSCRKMEFRGNVLFTHRGLSGPAILQISSYWQPGDELTINLLPDVGLEGEFMRVKEEGGVLNLKSFMAGKLPKRLVAALFDNELLTRPLQSIPGEELRTVAAMIGRMRIKPGGTEGYRTAEVTLGGIDCDELSSKTFECQNVPGLYFTGELLDVTGRLGGYNLQWAWSSGWSAGQYV